MNVDNCRHTNAMIQQYTDENQKKRYQQVCVGCRKVLKQTDSIKDLRIQTLRKLIIERKDNS